MKKSLNLFLSAALVAAALAAPSFAQTGGGEKPGPPGQPGKTGDSSKIDVRVKRLADELNLTADQQTKVKSIFQDEEKQLTAVSKDTSLSDQDRHAKIAEIHKNTTQQIRAILNAEQQKKYDEMPNKRGSWKQDEKPPKPPSDKQ
jgi:Spy/CpxP family protein refolding chaperone